MPTLYVQGKTLTCEPGANLRQVLMQNGIDLYNDRANIINCMGIGTCGTCAVSIEAAEATTIPGSSPLNWKEKARLALPPHSLTRDELKASPRRLACQVQVLGDLKISKGEGFWGQNETIRWGSDSTKADSPVQSS